jgi:hypothetical protein
MHIKRLVLVALVFALPVSASAASLYLDPDQGTYGPGDTFIANIRLNNDGECINAANVVLTYPASVMRAVDFGKGGSILSLWVVEPKIDTKAGTVTFAGGIPGGYCGRIQGDPSLTNIIGKVVFTVTNASPGSAVIRLNNASALYLNDGLGTKIVPELGNSVIKLVPVATLSQNPWLLEVKEDTTPPDSFDVQIESTRGFLGGKYYAVFSTVDKQSGLDHYEMVINGVWQRVTSPKSINDDELHSGVQVRAIDKAGNIRLGTYIEGSARPRQIAIGEYSTLIIILLLLVLALLARHILNRHHVRSEPPTIDLRT